MSLSPAPQEPPLPTEASLTRASPDATTGTATSGEERVTPPPRCRLLPDDPSDSDVECDLVAWFRGGCPPGYTSACAATQSLDSHVQYTMRDVTAADGRRASQTTEYEVWETAYMEIICCPDVLEYRCESRYGECATTAAGPLVMSYSPSGQQPTATTFAQGAAVVGHAATASLAAVRRARAGPWAWPREDMNTRLPDGGAATVWCAAPQCADVAARASIVTSPTAAATRDALGRGLRPPPGMGRVGPLGVFAVTALFGGVLFAAGVLGPWAWRYRRRGAVRTRAQ